MHDMNLFFFNDTATTEIYTLSLHDALPIYALVEVLDAEVVLDPLDARLEHADGPLLLVDLVVDVAAQLLGHLDRKSTRLNSSHANISYAVFCLKKKNTHIPSLSSLSCFLLL